ncbi:MAG: hypothetical protein U9P14_02355, partial [Gemmatimonadota bacterium]|nr:hypothetical protein [Gemmatimonadota bacterium]
MAPEFDLLLASAPSDSVVTVLVRPALEVDIHLLENELLSRRVSRHERHRRVVRTLKQKTKMSQQGILENLETLQNRGRVRHYKNFWITNLVAVTAPVREIRRLAARGDVAEIIENK